MSALTFHKPEQAEMFPGHPMGTPPPGWKPAVRPPRTLTGSGIPVITLEERDQFLKRAWLTVRDAAACIGCSDSQVYNYLAGGDLTATNVAGDANGERSAYRVDTRSVLKFLAARSTNNATR